MGNSTLGDLRKEYLAILGISNNPLLTENDLKLLVQAEPDLVRTIALVVGTQNQSVQIIADGVTDQLATLNSLVAAGNGILQLPDGPIAISGRFVMPDGWATQGKGGAHLNTSFKCLTSGSGVDVYGGGGINSGWCVDGNGISTQPLTRQGGTNGANRIFMDVWAFNSAGEGIRRNGAQNDVWIKCGAINCATHCLVDDHGYGGSKSYDIELDFASVSDYFVDKNISAGDVYPVPTDNAFYGMIVEQDGTGTVDIMNFNGGSRLNFYDLSVYATQGFAPTGPMVHVGGGASNIHFINPILENGNSGDVSGSIGIQVDAGCTAYISGNSEFLNLDAPVRVLATGYLGRMDDPSYFQCNASTSDGTLSSWMYRNLDRISQVFKSKSASDISYVALAGTVGEYFAELADGSRTYGDGTTFGNDVRTARWAKGVFGVAGAGHAISSGVWSTAGRANIGPPPANTIVMGLNTDTGNLDIGLSSGSAIIWSHLVLTAG